MSKESISAVFKYYFEKYALPEFFEKNKRYPTLEEAMEIRERFKNLLENISDVWWSKAGNLKKEHHE